MKDNSKIITEYHSLKTFIDRYKFYRKNQNDIRHIEPTNPLMIALEKANKIIDDERLKYLNGQSGAVYVNPSKELITAEEKKNSVIKAIEKYYKEEELNEPLPNGSFEHGQVIEYEVSQHSFETFESLRDGFLLKYSIIDNCGEYLDEVLEQAKKNILRTECNVLPKDEVYNSVEKLKELKAIMLKGHNMIDLVKLSKISISKNEFNFELFYNLLEEEKIKNDPFNQFVIHYKKLAQTIPLVLFLNYLKGVGKLTELRKLVKSNDILTTPEQVDEVKKVEILVKDEVNGTPCIEFDNLFGADISRKNEVWQYMKLLGMIDNEGTYLLKGERAIIRAFVMVMKKNGRFTPTAEEGFLIRVLGLKLLADNKLRIRKSKKIEDKQKEIVTFLNNQETKNNSFVNVD